MSAGATAGMRKHRSFNVGLANASNRPLAHLQDGPMDGRYAPDCGRTRNTTPLIRRWPSAGPIRAKQWQQARQFDVTERLSRQGGAGAWTSASGFVISASASTRRYFETTESAQTY